MTTSTLDLESLGSSITGTVVTPADPEWATARMAWNLAVDQHPAFVVQVAGAEDVVAVVRYARAAGLQVTPQATGHNAAPLGDLSSTILLRTDRLREVTVDADNRTVRVGAGAWWVHVTEALAPHGLTALAGSSPDVGVVGYTLGGGYSWLSRKYGLASARVRSIDLVTGDGDFRRVDAENDAELFWAVRGGGANVAVVCAMEFEVLPISHVYAGWMMFPLERAGEVLRAYEEWTRDLVEDATTCVRMVRLPPLPELPPFLSGQSLAFIDGAIDLPAEQAAELLAPLRALGPIMDTFATVPTSTLDQIHLDPPQPTPGLGDGFILDDLPVEAIETLLDVAGPGVESPLLLVDLRHLTGAIGRPDRAAGAVDHLPGRFLGMALGVVPFPQAAPAVREAVDALVQAIGPWRSSRDYLNFREADVPGGRFFSDQAIARLSAVRSAVNSDRTIRGNHGID